MSKWYTAEREWQSCPHPTPLQLPIPSPWATCAPLAEHHRCIVGHRPARVTLCTQPCEDPCCTLPLCCVPRPSIRAELVRSGPVVATFTVYEDFMNYKRGVYRYVTGKRLGLQ